MNNILTWTSIVIAVSVLCYPIFSFVMDKLEDRLIPPHRQLPTICNSNICDNCSPEENSHA